MTVFGADAAEILFFVAEQLDAFDDHGIFEEFSFEDRLLEDGVQFGVALLERAKQSVTGRVEELGTSDARKECGGAPEKTCGDKRAAIELHLKIPSREL